MAVQEEIQDVVKIGYLNGLFVLARSIGFIGIVNALHLPLSAILRLHTC